jgi:5-hydroxyisourate hydrolase
MSSSAEDSVATEPEQPRPTISTHVLDTERGVPAAGVHVTLSRIVEGKQPVRMTQALTDGDGRVRDLLERPRVAGDYRLEFSLAPISGDGTVAADGGAMATKDGDRAFFRRLAVDLRITDVGRSYHVPLLLSSYGLTTYRGS